MLKRLLLTLLVIYVVLIGATFNGVLGEQTRLVDALLIGLLLLLWVWSRRRWHWHRTALDGAILVWIAAFAISLVANFDSGRRIAIGLWFVGLYIGAWYLLQDVFANRGLRREWLVDALLIAGVPVTFVGFAQVSSALTNGLVLPRPVGTLGNANALAALLVMLLPFIAGRLRYAKTPLSRTLLAVYGLGVLGLLLLSFSRGGWIGAAVALGVWVTLSFPLRRWWRMLKRPAQAALVLGAVAVLAIGLFVIIQSLGLGGRGLEYRTWIYESALRLFAAHPLTGTGLFTFGSGLAQLNSMPPNEPLSHAHNVILNVAAELGIVGLLAVALTAWAILRPIRRVTDPTTAMGLAAFLGFATHQMFDIPAMMPAIALVGLATLVLALPSEIPVKRRQWQPILILLGTVALFVTGLWSTLNYREYVADLSAGLASGDYRTAAARLQPLANADPQLAIYPEEQGTLLGLAADAGDLQAAQMAALNFTRYTVLEPSYVNGWANLAVLDEQLGDLHGAAAAMHQAALLAPASWSILYRAGIYAEAAGDADGARALYQQNITLNPDITLIPGWNESPVRQAIPVSENQLSPLSQAFRLLEHGDLTTAQQVWNAFPGRESPQADFHILSLALALAKDDRPQADAQFQVAAQFANSPGDQAWIHLGMALLDTTHFDQEIAAANAELAVAPTGADWSLGTNIAYLQYLQLAVPRLFLPQVGFSEADPVFLYLLNNAGTLEKLRAATHP